MAKIVIQTKVIFGREKDAFEDSLNHFLTSIEQDNFVDVKLQEIQGMYTALVVFRQKRN
ncbi:MAG: sporulation protein Cse60 [Thermoproteota archaeon]|nr:sporulation protein Cse60 [Thermoproteota archaeon]